MRINLSMQKRRDRIPPATFRETCLFVCAAGGLLAFPLVSEAIDTKKEDQSVISLNKGNDQTLSSSALIKLLNSKLDGDHENLTLVIDANKSGEFARRAALGTGGIKGTWSVATSTSTLKRPKSIRTGNKAFTFTRPDGTVIDAVKLGNRFYQGYSAQYIGKLDADKNDVSAKSLHDTAEARNDEETSPQYKSSGKSADDMTVHGGDKANRAIIATRGNHPRLRNITNQLRTELKDAGYKDSEITFLSRKTSSIANLKRALDDMRKVLDAEGNRDKVNLFMYLTGQGAYMERTVAYRAGQLDQAGGGVYVADASSGLPDSTLSLDIFVAEPGLVADLKEELPASQGGFWLDDPNVERGGEAFISFSTAEEVLTTADRTVRVVLNDMEIGSVELNGLRGGDYVVTIPDSILDRVLPAIESNQTASISFQLPAEEDFFRMAVFEDYLSDAYPNLDYGIGIAAPINVLPEPSATAILILGAVVLLAPRARQMRR
ncbi:MAG: hypothetical protein CMJ18_02425 [Phycisphaeraceae bacterium]|nr:hypothetical protein [Phycisphaeraceae bacterium]